MRSAMIRILPLAGIVAGRALLTSDPQYGSAPGPKSYSPSTASGSPSVDLVASASGVAAPSGTASLHQREADLGPRGPYANGSATARDLVTSDIEVPTVEPRQNSGQPHEFVSVDLAPRDAVSSNGPSLVRRGRDPPDQAELNRINAQAQAGAKWIPWMSSMTPAPNAPATAAWQMKDAPRYGWSQRKTPANLAGLAVLQGLETVEGFEKSEANMVNVNKKTDVSLQNVDDWSQIQSRHDQPWYDHPLKPKLAERHPPRGGSYEGIFSMKQSVLVWTENTIPWPQIMHGTTETKYDPDPVPGLSEWSDIAYMDFFSTSGRQGSHLPSGTARPPAWFYLKLKDNPDTAEAANVRYCLQQFKIEDLPVYPSTITFPIGSHCYNALLGTKLLQNVVWFLLKRKETIRNSIVASITVWNGGSASDIEYHFLLHVRVSSPLLENYKNLNAAFEAAGNHGFEPWKQWGKFASKQGPKWPKPMRPVLSLGGGKRALFGAAGQTAGHANDPGVGSSTGRRPAAPAPAGGSGSHDYDPEMYNTTPPPG